MNTVADGDPAFIYSTGLLVRASRKPAPPLDEPPTDLTTRVNGVPGRIVLSWMGVAGARVYEVQYSTDLTGATGWSTVTKTPSKTKADVDGLTSGTKYALRVRALGNGEPSPWSGPVQRMAP